MPFVAGVTAVAQNDWFGSGDLVPSYAIACIPFAVFLWIYAALFSRLVRAWPAWLATLVGLLFGAMAGFLGTSALAGFFGPWMATMSVDVLKSWVASAAVFVPTAHLLNTGGMRKAPLLGATFLGLLGLAGFAGFSPLRSLVTGDQHLMLVLFRHIPGEQPLRIASEPEWLSERDRALIYGCGLTGTVECFGYSGSNSTNWPRAKAIIVFTTGPSKPARLPQPKCSTILYLQRADDFVAMPEQAPVNDRAIELFRDDRDKWCYWVELISGGKSGGEIGF
jgi:hypothetical protein